AEAAGPPPEDDPGVVGLEAAVLELPAVPDGVSSGQDAVRASGIGLADGGLLGVAETNAGATPRTTRPAPATRTTTVRAWSRGLRKSRIVRPRVSSAHLTVDPVVAGSSPVALARRKSRRPKGLRLLVTVPKALCCSVPRPLVLAPRLAVFPFHSSHHAPH